MIKILLNIKREKQIFRKQLLIAFSMCMLLLISCKQDLDIAPFYQGVYKGMDQSIKEYVLSGENEYTMFRELMVAGSMEWTLSAYNPHGNNYTLFLPTDDAFREFIAHDERYDSFQDLLNDADYVNTLVRFHVVNRALRRNDFPFGVLADTTLSGDFLTIGFEEEEGSTILKVNNEATILQPDIEVTNGYIHVINRVLKPVVFSTFEWLERAPGYSIFTQALVETGLNEVFKTGGTGGKINFPLLTLLAEHDNVLSKKGIFSLDDLKEKYSPGRNDYKETTNGLYQFIGYHILIGNFFLNNLEGKDTHYNNFADMPVRINGNGLEIRINQGVEVFDTIISGVDTSYIDYISIDYNLSNVATKNGAIHIINNTMEIFRPRPIQLNLQFLEEPVIARARQRYGEYIFNIKDIEDFSVIWWQGVDILKYVYTESSLTNVWGGDYLELNGDFVIRYETPPIIPGNYILRIRANDEHPNNAIIEVYLDGVKIGGNIDLTSNPNQNDAFHNFTAGEVVFNNYEKHLVEVRSLVPGRFTWDAVIFAPK